MNWKDYENIVFESFSAHHLHDFIRKDYHIKGRYSHRSRQIDIYIKQKIGNFESVTIIDSKNYNKKINIKIVESFISMMEDVDADYGILISELGFTKSALHRAAFNPKGIDLDIYDFKEITHHLQAEGALPYSSDNMALILAPFGWIVDAKKRDIPATCFLYKKGLTFEEALSNGEFAYVNFWSLKDNNFSIQDLSKFQVSNIEEQQQIEHIEYQSSINVLGKESMIRIIKIRNYSLIEITGFIHFDDFIFFCVCNTSELFLRRNLRKMHLLLKQTLPLKLRKS